MRELTASEREIVAGGAITMKAVLVEGNGKINENANSINTPAADNGLSGSKKHGAQVGAVFVIG
jgi:hypothetical protein